MAIATVVTRGYGNGTFSGTIPLVATRGYIASEAAATPAGAPKAKKRRFILPDGSVYQGDLATAERLAKKQRRKEQKEEGPRGAVARPELKVVLTKSEDGVSELLKIIELPFIPELPQRPRELEFDMEAALAAITMERDEDDAITILLLNGD